jgi:hypothetical protein
MNRHRLFFYIAFLLGVFLLVKNPGLLGYTSVLFVLSVIVAGAVPFLLGFVLQWILNRAEIPQYIPWLLSSIIILALWYFSNGETFGSTNNMIVGFLYVAISIVVVEGFIESGIRTLRRIRNRRQHGQALGLDATPAENSRVETSPKVLIKSVLVLIAGIIAIFIFSGIFLKFSNLSFNRKAVLNPIPDGAIVLVRSGTAYGAFILRSQKVQPESTEYSWYYRTDGKGVFNKNESSVYSGNGMSDGELNNPIKFGPFKIRWSANTEGQGWIYYQHSVGARTKPEDLQMCITSERDINAIDASDPKWIYRTSPIEQKKSS